MYDGWDDKLIELGYEAYSVKKLIQKGELLRSDFLVISYARDKNMVLITRDKENGNGCEENNIPYVLLNDDELLKIVEKKLKQFS